MSSIATHNSLARKYTFAGMILLLIIGQFSIWNASAQESTPDPNGQVQNATPIPVIVNTLEPSQISNETGGALRVFGVNFTPTSQIRIINTGNNDVRLFGRDPLSTSSVLVAFVPQDTPAGTYRIEVVDGTTSIQVTYGPSLTSLMVTPPPQISINNISPSAVLFGQNAALTVTGTNFIAGITAEIVNFGGVPVDLENSSTLTVSVPNNVGVGDYTLRLTAGRRGTATVRFSVVRPTATPPPAPTNEPPPTSPPPTPIPGQPSLVGRNFAANPSTIAAGGSSTLTFELVNQGNRTAQGVSVTLDSSGSFFAANGQASVLLPDIAPGGVVTVTFGVTAGAAVEAGPASVPFTVAYRDFEGEAKTSTVTLTLTIGESDPETSLVTLSRYMAQPNPVQPGQPVILTLLYTNSGNSTASDVVVRIATGEGAVLLAGPQGDAFPLGDIPAGGSASVEMPLVVAPGAKAGPQAQTINLTFVSGGEAKEGTSSITLDVEAAEVAAPVLLLDSYETGVDVLQPGETFTLTLNFKNVGTAPADDLLVTFGTVESSSGGGGGDGGSGGSGGGTGGGSSSSTTPSNTFAPLGSGGTLFAGTLAADGEILTLTQDFIVSGSVTSGIYSLPITLRYTKADGATAQETLRASLVVLMPPQLQTALQQPIPSEVFQGDLLLIGLTLTNIGQKSVEFRSMTIITDNGEVIEGAEMPLSTLPKEEELVISGVVIPAELGAVKVTVTLNYLNELNQPAALVFEYESTVIEAPVIEEPGGFEPPVIETPPPTEEPSSDDLLGRLLLGLLGLGS